MFNNLIDGEITVALKRYVTFKPLINNKSQSIKKASLEAVWLYSGLKKSTRNKQVIYIETDSHFLLFCQIEIL